MPWQQFVIETAATQLEEMEAALFECGALAVSLEDAGDADILEPGPGGTPLWPRMRRRARSEGGVAAASIRKQLERLLPERSDGDFESIVEQDWTQAWLAHSRPIVFGARLCVTPAEL